MGNSESSNSSTPQNEAHTHGEVSRVFRSKEEARDSYNKMSKTYDRFGKYEQPYRDEGLAILNVKNGEQALEIGFGTGHCLVKLAKAVGTSGHVCGIDISTEMKDIAWNRLKQENLHERISLCSGDALLLPYKNYTFDCVFSSFVIDLFDTPEIPIVLVQILRVLKPGGRLMLVSMSKKKSGVMQSLYEWSHRNFPNTVDCRPIYAEESVASTGFQIISTKDMPMYGLLVEVVLASKAEKDINEIVVEGNGQQDRKKEEKKEEKEEEKKEEKKEEKEEEEEKKEEKEEEKKEEKEEEEEKKEEKEEGGKLTY